MTLKEAQEYHKQKAQYIQGIIQSRLEISSISQDITITSKQAKEIAEDIYRVLGKRLI